MTELHSSQPLLIFYFCPKTLKVMFLLLYLSNSAISPGRVHIQNGIDFMNYFLHFIS